MKHALSCSGSEVESSGLKKSSRMGLGWLLTVVLLFGFVAPVPAQANDFYGSYKHRKPVVSYAVVSDDKKQIGINGNVLDHIGKVRVILGRNKHPHSIGIDYVLKILATDSADQQIIAELPSGISDGLHLMAERTKRGSRLSQDRAVNKGPKRRVQRPRGKRGEKDQPGSTGPARVKGMPGVPGAAGPANARGAVRGLRARPGQDGVRVGGGVTGGNLIPKSGNSGITKPTCPRSKPRCREIEDSAPVIAPDGRANANGAVRGLRARPGQGGVQAGSFGGRGGRPPIGGGGGCGKTAGC